MVVFESHPGQAKREPGSQELGNRGPGRGAPRLVLRRVRDDHRNIVRTHRIFSKHHIDFLNEFPYTPRPLTLKDQTMKPIDAKKPNPNTAPTTGTAAGCARDYPALAVMSPSFVVEIVVTPSG
jgi:hypothetical protein